MLFLNNRLFRIQTTARLSHFKILSIRAHHLFEEIKGIILLDPWLVRIGMSVDHWRECALRWNLVRGNIYTRPLPYREPEPSAACGRYSKVEVLKSMWRFLKA